MTESLPKRLPGMPLNPPRLSPFIFEHLPKGSTDPNGSYSPCSQWLSLYGPNKRENFGWIADHLPPGRLPPAL
jgi:hypothetical protein